MAVNLRGPDKDAIYPVSGITLYVSQAGIKQPNRHDVVIIKIEKGNTVAGLFTQNRFSAAPVQICKQHLEAGVQTRALVINSGNANAGTGWQGRRDALTVCQAVAKDLSCTTEQVLPFSTGVIFEPLPVDKLLKAVGKRQPADWMTAARAIMTTDTVPKVISRKLKIDNTEVVITGMAKGAGMIQPNLATMLAFIATDVALTKPLLQQMLVEVADQSFNQICVDGDTSTNDSVLFLSTGKSALPLINSDQSAAYQTLKAGVLEVAVALAQAVVRDGEGATKFITINVEGGRSHAECQAVAYAIARSPLVKTAFFASDPNIGRLLSAIGNADIPDLDTERLALWLDDLPIVEKGVRHSAYLEEKGAAIMQRDEITIRVQLGRGTRQTTVWTCDFSYDYVKINAEYRS